MLLLDLGGQHNSEKFQNKFIAKKIMQIHMNGRKIKIKKTNEILGVSMCKII